MVARSGPPERRRDAGPRPGGHAPRPPTPIGQPPRVGHGGPVPCINGQAGELQAEREFLPGGSARRGGDLRRSHRHQPAAAPPRTRRFRRRGPRGLQRGARGHPAGRGRRPAPVVPRRRLRRGGDQQLRVPALGPGRVRPGRRGPGSWPPPRPASPGSRRPAGAGGPTPEGWVAGSLGPGTKIASLGQITFAEQRDGYQEAAAGLARGRRRPVRHRDRPGSPAGQGGHHRLPAGHGRGRPRRPHPGSGDHRDHRPHADGHRDRRRPHHPRRPAPGRHRPQLRHRARRR